MYHTNLVPPKIVNLCFCPLFLSRIKYDLFYTHTRTNVYTPVTFSKDNNKMKEFRRKKQTDVLYLLFVGVKNP